MASLLITGLLVLIQGAKNAKATPVSYPVSGERTNGFCKELDIPVFVTAETAVYDIPQVNNDLEATAWAIWDATRSTPHGPASIISNTTTSETFNIHAQLCVPKSSDKKDILQIATHGVHYDSRYWDSKFKPEEHSYVEASLKSGYAILTYDRLGVGQSDHPDAYNTVQAPVELEILHQLTLMARNGSLYEFAAQAQPAEEAFKGLEKPSKTVHLGHSFGSFLTSAFIATYPDLTDGAVITGYYFSMFLASTGSTTFAVEYAATANPPYDRTSGYVVSRKDGIQNVFFGGDLKTAYTEEMLNYGDEIKQPVPIGEFASAWSLIGLPALELKAPVQILLPEFDFYICRGDCKGLANETELALTYPKVADIKIDIQPNTGHALPLHNNATAGFQLTFDFLAENGM